MNIHAYLQRLQYAGPVEASVLSLQELHYHHLLSIPIENLDIHLGREISLETDDLFDKLITRRRGGFCYELNGLFYELLNQIGFRVKRVSGRAYDPEKGFNPEFDHVAIVANVDGIDWLVDVGFGRRFPLYPLAIRLDEIQHDPSGRYMITTHDADYLALKQQVDTGDWVIGYIFSLIPRQLDEFAPMCRFHQLSEASYFTQNKLCTLVTKSGRITLTDNHLKQTINGQTVETPVTTHPHFMYLLASYFGIKLNSVDNFADSKGYLISSE
ncbi:arylamine N-acetyltransferase family protein [Spirosoma areae]